jgi:nucleotide-binding universal stress UspA family protein
MFKTIVWAADGSENTEQALPYVKSLAKTHGASLVVAHVEEKYATHSTAGVAIYPDEELVQEKLKQIVAGLSDEGLSVTLRLATHVGPQPAHEIAKIAEDVKADLIVVGTRGHTRIGGLLLGSVTTRLLHVAACPVLTVPPKRQPTVDDREPEVVHATG